MANTALNRSGVVSLTNKSGGSVAYGDTVILDTTTAASFTTTTTGALSTRQIGVVMEPNGIANNAAGMIGLSGYVPKTNLSSSASLGDLLKTHTVAKQAAPHASPQVEGDFAQVLGTGTTPAAWLFGPNPPAVTGGSVVNSIVDGRLTTETGVAVSTSDRTAQSTIYFTPYLGNRIALYTGSAWTVSTFSELSLALSGLTGGKNYDVYVDYNSGTPQLVLSAAWTNDTTRADAYALQDGVPVKSGTTTYRLVGTIRALTGTTTEDSRSHRLVANLYNRKRREMYVTETTDSWAYTTASWRQANASASNQVDFVVCLGDEPFRAQVAAGFYSASNVNWAVGIGVNSTTANSARTFGVNTNNFFNVGRAEHEAYPGIGYTYLAWLEYGATGGTFYGDAGAPTILQYGLTAIITN